MPKKTVTFISAAQGPWFKFCAAVRGHALNPGRRPQAIYHTDQCIGESAESYIFYILSSNIFKSYLIEVYCTHNIYTGLLCFAQLVTAAEEDIY